MHQLHKFIIFWLSLALRFALSHQEDLTVQSEEKLQPINEDANYLLNSVNKNLNQELDDDLLSLSFDSSVHYKIDWKQRPGDLVLNDSVLTLTTKDSSNFHCVLPTIEHQDQTAKEDVTVDPYSKIEHLFKKKTCIYKLDSYWTYELCLNEHLRQFNGDILEKKHTQEYMLGKFKSSSLDRSRKEHNKRVEHLKSQNKAVPRIDYDGVKVPYLDLWMDDGTVCDLTGQPRTTRVYFVCDRHEKPQLESIEEIQSCEYEAIVSTGLLCDHPDFKEKKENELQINCFPDSNENQPVKPLGLEQFETKPLDLYSDTILQQIHEMMSNSKFKVEMETIKSNTKIKTVDKSKFMSNEMSITSFVHGAECYVSSFKTYWKYSFCFKKEIKMFHEEAGITTQTISLGKFNEAKHLAWMKANPDKKRSQNEISYLFSSGDICHETNRLRYVEARLRCLDSETRQFTMTLEEPKLCEYRLTLQSNLVCKLLELVDENGL